MDQAPASGLNLTRTSRRTEETHVLARYVKTQSVVLLCGGLVGPIFLVVYFTLNLGNVLQ